MPTNLFFFPTTETLNSEAIAVHQSLDGHLIALTTKSSEKLASEFCEDQGDLDELSYDWLEGPISNLLSNNLTFIGIKFIPINQKKQSQLQVLAIGDICLLQKLLNNRENKSNIKIFQSQNSLVSFNINYEQGDQFIITNSYGLQWLEEKINQNSKEWQNLLKARKYKQISNVLKQYGLNNNNNTRIIMAVLRTYTNTKMIVLSSLTILITIIAMFLGILYYKQFQENNQYQKQNHNLLSQIQLLTTKKETLNIQLEEVKKKAATLQKQLDEQKITNKNLTAQKAELQAKINKLEQDVKRLENEVDSLLQQPSKPKQNTPLL